VGKVFTLRVDRGTRRSIHPTEVIHLVDTVLPKGGKSLMLERDALKRGGVPERTQWGTSEKGLIRTTVAKGVIVLGKFFRTAT